MNKSQKNHFHQLSTSKIGRYVWRCFILILLIGGFPLQSAFASDQLQIVITDSISVNSSVVNLSINEQGYEVDSEVTFGVKIFNSNPNWIHILPADLTFDNQYLEWLDSSPETNVVLGNASHWNDLTIVQGNIAPYRFAMISFKFKTLKPTESLAGDTTLVRLVIHNAKAGPESYDSKANEVTLPDMVLDIPIKIYDPITQTSTPTVATSPSHIVIEIETSSPTATPSATAIPAETVTSVSTETPTPLSTDQATSTPDVHKIATTAPTASQTASNTAIPTRKSDDPIEPSLTEVSIATSAPTSGVAVTASPAETEVPSVTATPVSPAIPKSIEHTADVVSITWQTTDESNILGFDVMRLLITGEKERVNQTLIPAKEAGSAKGATYTISDPDFVLVHDSSYELDVKLTSGRSVTKTLGLLRAAHIALSDSGIDLNAEGISISWRTNDETYIKCFDILRYNLPMADTRSSSLMPAEELPLTQINEEMVPAFFSGENAGASYKYVDHSSRIGGGGGYGYKLRILLRNDEILIVDVGMQEPIEIQIHAEINRSDEAGVNIQWITYNESFIKGFHILRQETPTKLIQLTNQLIPALHAGKPMGTEYEYSDTAVTTPNNYTYQIVLVLSDESNVQIELSMPATHEIFLPLINRGSN